MSTGAGHREGRGRGRGRGFFDIGNRRGQYRTGRGNAEEDEEEDEGKPGQVIRRRDITLISVIPVKPPIIKVRGSRGLGEMV